MKLILPNIHNIIVCCHFHELSPQKLEQGQHDHCSPLSPFLHNISNQVHLIYHINPCSHGAQPIVQVYIHIFHNIRKRHVMLLCCLLDNTLIGLSQSLNGGSGSNSSRSRQYVCPTSHYFLTCRTIPNTRSFSFDSILTAEDTVIFGMLSNFHLLDNLSQGSTISSTIFTTNSYLLCVLSLLFGKKLNTSKHDNCLV